MLESSRLFQNKNDCTQTGSHFTDASVHFIMLPFRNFVAFQ